MLTVDGLMLNVTAPRLDAVSSVNNRPARQTKALKPIIMQSVRD
jgi:hypothetical protein